MKQVIKEAMGDCSTIGEFRFLLHCQECGRTWHSSPVRFSKAGTRPETEGMRAVFRTLYERERAAAREKAAAEASEIFSQCPVCGKLVCDHCFRDSRRVGSSLSSGENRGSFQGCAGAA